MVKEIITDLEQLSERCDEVKLLKQKPGKTLEWFFEDKEELNKIIVDLKQTLREHSNGVGLSANQIGYDKRVFVMNFNGDIRTYINPSISLMGPMGFNRESCLSLPNKEYIIPRARRITVSYLDPNGIANTVDLKGYVAFVFQHELDHLNGVTLADIGLEIDENFEKASEEEQEELIQAYREMLLKKEEELNKEIEKDEELSKTKKAIEFMEKVQKGELEIESVEVDKQTKEKIEEKLQETAKKKTRKKVIQKDE